MLADIFRVDCYIPEFNLIVESNGPFHYNGLNKLNKTTEARKNLLKKLGY